VSGGNSYSSFHNDAGATGNLNAYQVGLYALRHNEEAYWLGTANDGYDSFSTNRPVTIGTFNQALHGNYGANQFGANTEAGLKFDLGWVHIQPLAGLQYLYLAQQSIHESGGPGALNVGSAQADALRSSFGTRINLRQFTGRRGAVWTPYWQGRFVSDLLPNDRIVNASIAGAPAGGVFTTYGSHVGRNYGLISKGVQVQFNDHWSMFGSIDVMFGGHLESHTGAGGMVYSW
jgi:outer membrane autotransporter protein